MGVMDEAEEIHLTTAAQWLVSFKQRTGKPAIGYEDAVCEALCFGWIDSTYRRLDDERGALWWSPRRKGSLWARTNKERVERLEAEGRMTEAGRAAIERAKSDGSWRTLEPVEELIVPEDLDAAFEAHHGACEYWDGFPATAQRAYLSWIYTAKRASTRRRRVEETAQRVAAGLRSDER